MERIQNLEAIWDNGAVSPSSLTGEALMEFRLKAQATRVVAQRWTYRGKLYETPDFVRLLPDETGLVHWMNSDPEVASWSSSTAMALDAW